MTPSIGTKLGKLKVQSHRIERSLARHLSRHVDSLWRDVVSILRTKPHFQWEPLIHARHRLYVAVAYAEYERQMIRVVVWQREQLRRIFARRFPWLKSEQSLTREDGFPLLSLASIGLALASDTVKQWLASLGLLTLSWFSRTRAGSPQPLLQTLRQATLQKTTTDEVIAAVKPRIQQTKNSLGALARTAVAVVSTQSVIGTSRKLGCVGFQVHSVLEPATRWRHRVRHRTKYYFNPDGPDERGMNECPIPPRESDGSLAHGCLCWLTPLFDQVADDADDDVVLRVFRKRGLVA